MGYGPIPLNELTTLTLIMEISRRKELLAKGVCPYCNLSIATHNCKYKEVEEPTFGIPEGVFFHSSRRPDTWELTDLIDPMPVEKLAELARWLNNQVTARTRPMPSKAVVSSQKSDGPHG